MAIKTKVKRSAESEVVLLYNAFDDFIMEKEAINLSPASIKSYQVTFRIFCNFFEFDNETDIAEINQQLIFKWIGTMKLQDLTISSINHYLRDMRCFLYWCMSNTREYIEEFKIQLLSKQEEAPKCFDDDEIERLLEKPRNKDNFATWRTWAVVSWILATGNRAATICDVQIKDIDFKRKEIELKHTKNKKAQIIPLSSSLETVLKEYIRIWRKGVDSESYLFCNIGDEKLTTSALRQSFRKFCIDREVEHTNIHGLRHSFAKGWVKNNGNTFALQKMLGHSTLDMTRVYVKLYGEDLKDDFEKYSPLDVIKRKQKRTQTVKRNF